MLSSTALLGNFLHLLLFEPQAGDTFMIQIGAVSIFFLLITAVWLFMQRKHLLEKLSKGKAATEKYMIEQENLQQMALEISQRLEQERHGRLEDAILYQKKLLDAKELIMQVCQRVIDETDQESPKATREESLRLAKSIVAKLLFASENEVYFSDNVQETSEHKIVSDEETLAITLKELYPFLKAKEIKLAVEIFVGYTSQEIATREGVSVKAIEKRRTQLRDALKLPPKTQLADYLKSLMS